ncbi:MAG: hypothetical protein HQM12_12270 [SAR324 cluster bacterium]|nr:hypothetical protein [SAR324 cluster bacterium]
MSPAVNFLVTVTSQVVARCHSVLDTESIGALMDPRFHGDDIVEGHRISSANYLQQDFLDVIRTEQQNPFIEIDTERINSFLYNRTSLVQ